MRISTTYGACAVFLLLSVSLGAGTSCQRFTKEGADTEVYGLLGARRDEVPELQGTLDIEAKEKLAQAVRERKTFELTLRDALELGTVSSREYRRRRENVYLAALDLTRELNRFRPLWDLDGSVDVRGDEDGSDIGGNVGLTLRRAFERGGSVVIGLASNFLREISGDPLDVAQSILSADVVLPLLRGSGELIARESLTQAERNVMYALRDYARFQQEFTVSIATSFYRSLQARDSWKNAEARYDNLKVLVDEQREKAAAGRLPKFEVDQVEQDLLESDDARQRARNNYVTSIDRLKLDLGIPVVAELTLDDSDLEALRRVGPQAASQEREEALSIAAGRRLDLRTERDREEDAKRTVRVAADALRAGLDLRLGGDVATPGNQPLNVGRADASGNIGLDFDLPLERTNERNTYRRALIEQGRAQRSRERFEDTVVFEVRDAYRSLAEAKRSYEIQKESLRLAERRVESTQLLLELGDAKTRDRLDAETSLVRARDAVTAALVDHVLARMGLERDVGTLRVDAEGMWIETGKDAAPSADVAGTTAPPPVVQPRKAGVQPSATPAARPAPEPAAQPPQPAGGLPPPQVIPRRSTTVGS